MAGDPSPGLGPKFKPIGTPNARADRLPPQGVRTKNVGYDNEVENLRAMLDMSRESGTLVPEFETLRHQMMELLKDDAVVALSAMLDKYRDEIATASKGLITLAGSETRLKAQLEDKDRQIEELRSRRHPQEEQHKVLEALRLELAEVKNRAAQGSETVDDITLRMQVAETKRELEEAKANWAKTLQREAQATQELHNLRQEIHNLRQGRQAWDHSNQLWGQERDDLASANEVLVSELDSLKQQMATMRKDARASEEKMEKEITHRRRAQEKAERALKEAERSRDNAKATARREAGPMSAELQDSVAALRRERAVLQNTVNNLRRPGNWREQKKQMEEELNELRQRQRMPDANQTPTPSESPSALTQERNSLQDQVKKLTEEQKTLEGENKKLEEKLEKEKEKTVKLGDHLGKRTREVSSLKKRLENAEKDSDSYRAELEAAAVEAEGREKESKRALDTESATIDRLTDQLRQINSKLGSVMKERADLAKRNQSLELFHLAYLDGNYCFSQPKDQPKDA